MTEPLSSAEAGSRLAEVYRVLGPLYRTVQRRVVRDEPLMGMSVGVRAVLDSLRAAAPMTVPQLAEHLELSRQFVQRMVNDAREANWLELRTNPHHRRSPLLTLTTEGQRAVDHVLDREHALMGHVAGRLTAQEVDSTLHVLRQMLLAVRRLDHEDNPAR